MWQCGVDAAGLRELFEGSSEHGCRTLGSTKGNEFPVVSAGWGLARAMCIGRSAAATCHCQQHSLYTT